MPLVSLGPWYPLEVRYVMTDSEAAAPPVPTWLLWLFWGSLASAAAAACFLLWATWGLAVAMANDLWKYCF